MLKLTIVTLILLINSQTSHTISPRAKTPIPKQDPDCFPVRDDSGSLVCRSVPKCNENTMRLYSHYKQIVFDLENKYQLSSRQFYNCSFSWSNKIELLFKNIKKLSSFAFDSIKIEQNVLVLLKFDGSGLNLDKHKSNSKFLINENSFNNIVLGKKAQLIIHINNYQNLIIKDNLVQNIAWQCENSEISLNLNNIEQISFKNRNGKNLDDDLADYDTDELDTSNEFPITLVSNQMHTLKSNLSYSLMITNVNSLVFDPQVFSGIQINSYSEFNIFVKNIKNLYLANGLFDSLMLGFYSKFNCIMENINNIGLGKSLFSGLQTDQYSVLFFHLDQIGSKYVVKSKKKRQVSDYENSEEIINVFDNDNYQYYDEDDSMDKSIVSPYTNWLCIPEALFKNVRMSDSSLIQVHFTQIDLSISLSADSFKEIELNKNSKFQIMFQDIKGNVIVGENAINLIKLSDGIFELWVDNQRQLELARGYTQTENETRRFSSKVYETINENSNLNLIRTLNTVKNNYFKFMDNSISKIFLTSRSNFRLGFLNSDSMILLNTKSMSDFHLDRFDKSKESLDYRTKLEIDLSGSDNFLLDFMPDLLSNNENLNDLSLPKLIEIDGYKPIVSLIKPDQTIEIVFPESITELKNSSRKKMVPKSDSLLTDEFCRFFKLRPFMTSIGKSTKLNNNLAYFSQTSITDYIGESFAEPEKSKTCTSCLLIYLYRTVHRRIDFFYAKDLLPACFINLHFESENIGLINSNKRAEKLNYIKKVEDSMKLYWKLLECKKITGLSLILNYDSDTNESDGSKENYALITKKCKETNNKFVGNEVDLMSRINSDSWQESSTRICLKNAFDSKSNKTNRIELNLTKKTINKRVPKSNSGTSVSTVLLLVIVMASFSGLVFMYVKYNRPKKPCLRLNLNRGNKNFQRLENNQLARASNREDHDDDAEHNNEQSYDELNGYEYDDEFELNENSEENLNYSSNENVGVKVVNSNKGAGAGSTSLGSLKNKSLRHMKRLKNNFLNKELVKSSLLNVTNKNHPQFNKNKKNKYSGYSYNSTDSTLVQTKIQNEFELKSDRDDVGVEMKTNSVVTYDVKNRKAKPNLVDGSNDLSIDLKEDNGTSKFRIMRVSTNPLDKLDLNEDDKDLVNTNRKLSIDKEHSDSNVRESNA